MHHTLGCHSSVLRTEERVVGAVRAAPILMKRRSFGCVGGKLLGACWVPLPRHAAKIDEIAPRRASSRKRLKSGRAGRRRIASSQRCRTSDHRELDLFRCRDKRARIAADQG